MEKDYWSYALYGVLALSVAALVFAFAGWAWGGSAPLSAAAGAPVSSDGFPAVSTGSTGEGDVEIELTPSWSSGKLNVGIAANTHSVDLSGFNLKEITTLQYDGKTLKPVSAPALTGHHASGLIVFETAGKPKSFAIRISRIPAEQERVFEWD